MRVIAESIALGGVGALTGSLIGIVLVVITHWSGIDYSWLAGGGPSELSFAGLRFSLRFYPALSAVDVVRAIGGSGLDCSDLGTDGVLPVRRSSVQS